MAVTGSLPVGTSAPWPPPAWQDAYRRYTEAAAWYSGDPFALTAAYGGSTAPLPYQSWNDQRTQQGIVQTLVSRFWGRAKTAPQTRAKYHVPLASDIATASADLLFSEPPDFVVPDAHAAEASADAKAIQDRLLEVANADGWARKLLEGAEVTAALGDGYLRVTWDRDIVPDRPILTFVHADAAVPEFTWGILTAVTFWQVISDDKNVTLRHLERHEPGRISHALYMGSAKELGQPVPLSTAPETRGLAIGENGTDMQQGVEPIVIETGIPYMTAVWVPNMRPNRLDRRSQLGRSDWQGSEPLLDALDESWSSWMRDIRLARARIIVPPEYLDDRGRGRQQTFDLDREIFTPLAMPPQTSGANGSGLVTFQPEIRWQAHQSTCTALVEQIINAAGFSNATFGLQGPERQQPQTATEIEARERRSFVTRNKKVRYWTPALEQILRAYLALDATMFGGPGEMPVRIDFGDSVQDSIDRTATTIQLLNEAVAVSIDTKVRMAHPDWDDETVAAEVQRIREESGVGQQPAIQPPGLMPPDPSLSADAIARRQQLAERRAQRMRDRLNPTSQG